MAITVAIVDDNEMWPRTLRDTVEQEGRFEVTVHETNPVDFIDAVDRERPHIALVDLRMPPSNEEEGISVARRLRTSHPRMGIAVVSGLEGPLRHKYVESRLENAGTGPPIGFLYKDRLTPESLHADLMKLHDGQVVVDSTIASEAIADIVKMQQDSLTETEDGLMSYVAQGWRDDRIANALSMSSSTVERLSKRTFDRLIGEQSGNENRRVRASIEWLRRRGEL